MKTQICRFVLLACAIALPACVAGPPVYVDDGYYQAPAYPVDYGVTCQQQPMVIVQQPQYYDNGPVYYNDQSCGMGGSYYDAGYYGNNTGWGPRVLGGGLPEYHTAVPRGMRMTQFMDQGGSFQGGGRRFR